MSRTRGGYCQLSYGKGFEGLSRLDPGLDRMMAVRATTTGLHRELYRRSQIGGQTGREGKEGDGSPFGF